jgi:sec-independent protein translocase protein TatB
MFDIGWSEMLVIAAVTIVVVGPKELPRMLRTFGRTMGTVRRTANDFKRQFDEALREAEREAGLEDAKKQLKSAAEPFTDAKKDFDATVRSASRPTTPPRPGTPAPAPIPAAGGPSSAVHEAPPLKTGAASAAGGADAA